MSDRVCTTVLSFDSIYECVCSPASTPKILCVHTAATAHNIRDQISEMLIWNAGRAHASMWLNNFIAASAAMEVLRVCLPNTHTHSFAHGLFNNWCATLNWKYHNFHVYVCFRFWFTFIVLKSRNLLLRRRPTPTSISCHWLTNWHTKAKYAQPS